MYTYPSVADFKAHFFRDFPYGIDPDEHVLDADITKAMAEAKFGFNEALFSSQENFTLAFLYLTAHFLVMDLRASAQGLSGSYSWLTASKAVGSVSESYSIPQRILDNPALSMLTRTNYGAKYVLLIFPLLVGQAFIVCGSTHA